MQHIWATFLEGFIAQRRSGRSAKNDRVYTVSLLSLSCATSSNYRTAGRFAGKGRERSDYAFPAGAVQVEQSFLPGVQRRVDTRGEGPRGDRNMPPSGRRVTGMVYGASDREPISTMTVRPIEYLSVYACLPALPACSANYPRPLALAGACE